MRCPNFETCEGEIEFQVAAECTEKSCSCELTEKQWTALEKAAIEREPTYD